MQTRTRIALAAASAVAALGAVAGAYCYWRTVPTPQATYYGVELGRDTKAEINYKLGNPDHVVGQRETSGEWKGFARVFTVNAKPDDKNALPLGKDFEAYDEWEYAQGEDGSGLSVSFSNSSGKVNEVRCYSMGTVPGACEALMGIQIGDSEEGVRRRLGPPTDASIEGPTKTLVYQGLHVMLILTKQRVYGMAIGRWMPAKR